MFRPDSRIVKAGRDRVGVGDLAMPVLQKIGLVAVQNAGGAGAERGRVLACFDAVT